MENENDNIRSHSKLKTLWLNQRIFLWKNAFNSKQNKNEANFWEQILLFWSNLIKSEQPDWLWRYITSFCNYARPAHAGRIGPGCADRAQLQ